MNTSLVITAIGADRPGIVNELTEVLLDADLNIEDSRMAVLGGEFAVMLLVTGSTASIDLIKQQKNALENTLKLNLLIKTTQKQASDTNNSHTHYSILVEGMDNPGIVHKLTRYLSQQYINIVNMQTDSHHAPHTGTPLFTVKLSIHVPAGLNIDLIKKDFTTLCDELNMDAEFNTVI